MHVKTGSRALHLGLAAAALLVLARPVSSHAVLTMSGSTPARYSLGVSPDIPEIWGFFSAMLNPVPTGAVRVCGSMSGLHTGEVVTADNVIIFRNQSGSFFRGEV